jgi:oligopeptide transport system ATP-binding protein
MSIQDGDVVLDVRDLQTYFFTGAAVVKAVDGVSYQVKRGECVAIVGESGCGKSASAMSVLRLIPYPPGVIVGGEVLFKGEDLVQAPESRMREIRGNRIAMVFQEAGTSLNPVLTVGKQITETITLHRRTNRAESRREAVELLRMVGIPDAEKRINDYPHQFSGGMQQRIMIAIALSCQPEVIIADEPTTALDVTVQAQVLELMDRLRETHGTAIVIITHNLGVVARYVDRVNVMYAGKIIESGPTDKIYGDPLHPYTLGLLQSVPRLDIRADKDLRVIKGQPPNMAALPPGCSFAPRCPFVMDRCAVEEPRLVEETPQHFRACFADVEDLRRSKRESHAAEFAD